jgi:PAS domain S-box-containing protein
MVIPMDGFVQLLRDKQPWLMERILGYATEHGYVRYTSNLLEAWRLSIAGLTEAIAAALSDPGGYSTAIMVDTDWNEDPVTRFGVTEARKHRERGIPLGMFLGLFIDYRQSYRDCVREFYPPGSDRDRLDQLVVSLFDRMGTAFCVHWTQSKDEAVMANMASTLRDMTNEKNRYLNFFESVACPVIFINGSGLIDDLNSAAGRLVNSDVRPGQEYYAVQTESQSESLHGKLLEDVFPWLEELMRSVLTHGDLPKECDVSFSGPQGIRYYHAVLNRQPDVLAQATGYSLVLHDETEGRQVREFVIRAKEELERTFDTISDLVFLVDNNWTILRANKSLADQLGVSPRDLIGRTCRDVLGCSLCSLPGESCVTEGIPVSFANMSGSFLVSRNLLRDRTGNPFGSVFVARDVTTMERIRGTLMDIEKKYKNIFENAREGIFQSTLEGQYLSLNPAMARIFGFDSPEEMRTAFTDIGKQMYVHPEDRRAIIDEGLAKGIVMAREVPLRRKDCSVFWAELKGRVVRDAEGYFKYFEGFVEDVSERRRFVEELAQSEKRFRSLVETMSQGLVQIDPHGVLTYCNDHFCELVGMPRDQMLGRALESLIHSDDKGTLGWLLKSDFGSEAQRHLDIRFCKGTSHVFTIVTAVQLSAAKGDEGGFWLLVMDVTQRKLLEAQLLQTQKLEAIGQLAAGIAHEINTPTQYVLNNMWFIKEAIEQIHAAIARHEEFFARVSAETSLTGGVAELRARDLDQQIAFYLEELPAAISETLQGLERITAIVGSVKQFAHPGHEMQRDVDVNALVENTVNLSRNEWKYVADLSMDLDPELPAVSCQMQEIGQVLLNLVINAAHAIVDAGDGKDDVRGSIHISTRRKGEWAEIRVQDTGTGIPEHAQPHIFEPFFTTKPVGTGTGQGLFIAHRSVVKHHGGNISFETQAGQGTTFVITLPLAGRISDGHHA